MYSCKEKSDLSLIVDLYKNPLIGVMANKGLIIIEKTISVILDKP